MSVTKLDTLPDFVPVKGYHGKMIHSERMTVAHWNIDGGYELPEHSHPHEQIVNMMQGEFELTVAGTPHRLVAGDVVVIPGNVPHSGRSITDCKIIDVWNPPRDDYKV